MSENERDTNTNPGFDIADPVPAAAVGPAESPAPDAAPDTSQSPARATRLLAFPGGRPDLDGPAVEAVEAAAQSGGKVHLRIQPDLAVIGGQGYRSWPGVTWKAEFADANDLIDFRTYMDEAIKEWFRARAAIAAIVDEANDRG